MFLATVGAAVPAWMGSVSADIKDNQEKASDEEHTDRYADGDCNFGRVAKSS